MEEKFDLPQNEQLYQLTGKKEDRCIANGNTWKASKKDLKNLNKKETNDSYCTLCNNDNFDL